MSIQTVALDEAGQYQGQQVEINAGENIQCCRVLTDPVLDANELWFFEPAADFAANELAGQLISPDQMTGPPVILRFNTSAVLLPILQDLTIIYGNLVKAGL